MFRRSSYVDFLSRSGSPRHRLRKGPRRRKQSALRSQLQFETLEIRNLLAVDVLGAALPELDNDAIAYSPIAPANEESGGGEGDAPYPLAQTFFLNSNPESLRNIYLDFDGHITVGTQWNSDYGMSEIVSTPWDFDGDPDTFSDPELTEIQGIWERVVEDFRPFDVNVTTEDPGVESLRNAGGGNSEYGIRVIVTPDENAFLPAGGVAYLNSFDWNSDTPAFSWNAGEKNAGETVSHEVGHTVGLSHDGRDALLEEYYPGHGTGETSWGAIMGGAFDPNVTQWSQGEYLYANNQEDDLTLINNYLDYKIDDHGNSILATTSELTVESYFVSTGEGIIERNTDVDYFEFTSDPGTLEVDISPFYRGPNLDIGATLYDADGTELFSDSPDDTLNVSFSIDVDGGTYYIAVYGTGKPAELDHEGYSDYGSLGYYSISVARPDTIKGIDLLTNSMVVDPADSLGVSVVTTVDFTLLNRGNVASGDFDVSFYLSDDDVINPFTDVLLTLHPFDANYDQSQPGIYSVPEGLDAGSSMAETVVLALPFGDPIDTDDSYYIGVVSDVNNEVVEANEVNNHSIAEGVDLANVRFSNVVHSFNLDTQPSGWTTEGEWAFGPPTGQGGELFGTSDPLSGASGTNVYGVDLDGNYDLLAGGPWYLTTAALDFTGFQNVILEFDRWLNTDFQDHVFASIEVSNNGTDWTTVFSNPGDEAIVDLDWQTVQYDVSDVADNQPEVYVRWGYAVGVDAFSYSGWNIDEIIFLGMPQVEELGQISGTIWGDVNGDGVQDPEDNGLEGWTVLLDENDNGVVDSDTQTVDSTDVPVAIEDEATVMSYLRVDYAIGAIDSLSLGLDISHGNPSDLDLFLTSPAGTRVELGGIAGGSLSHFDGEDPTGRWTLEIADEQEGSTGTLNDWSLSFDTTERSTLTDSEGTYSFTGLASDFYKVFPEIQSGWTQTMPVGMTFLDTPLGPGQFLSGNDFAYTTDSEINGVLWEDTNSDGIIDGGESRLEGQIVYVDENGNGVRDLEYIDFASTDVPVDIPDLNTVTSTITVEGAGMTIADVNVTLNISHSFDGDLEVFLRSPSDTLVELFSDIGTNGTGFIDTTFDDDASVSITEGPLPYTGTFRPMGSLADFLVEDPNGDWTLEISDDESGDTGTLNSWSLSIGTSELFAVTNAAGEYSIDDVLAGEYDVRQVLQDDWEQTSPLTPAQTVVVGANSSVDNVNFGSREAPSADFNEDNAITGRDFLALQRGYGSGSSHPEGDANGDGQVDDEDIDVWESQYSGVMSPESVVEEESAASETAQAIAAAGIPVTAQPSAVVAQHNASSNQTVSSAGSSVSPFTASLVTSQVELLSSGTNTEGGVQSSLAAPAGRGLFAFAPLSSLMTRGAPFQFLDSLAQSTSSTVGFSGEVLPEDLIGPLAGTSVIDELFGSVDDKTFRIGSDGDDEESELLLAVAENTGEEVEDGLWRDWL